VIQNFKGLPFTTRHLIQYFTLPQIRFALREMKQQNIIKEFPPLKDKDNGLVSQAEHSLIVRDKPIVFTRI